MRYLILVTFIVVFTSMSCNKDEFPEAEFYIRCKIDGEKYLPNNCANCMRGQLLGDTLYMMNANAGYQTVFLGVERRPQIEVGNYVLNSPTSGAGYKNSTTTNDRFDTDGMHTGELVITSLDKTKKIIAGTFQFQAYNPVQNKKVIISNGEFRLRYTDY